MTAMPDLVESGLSADAVARLQRARAAWQAARPGDAEVQAAVRRIARARRARRRRRDGWRGGALITVGLLLLGALAYAATAGPRVIAQLFSNAAPADSVLGATATATAARQIAGGSAAPLVAASAAHATKPDVVAAAGARARGRDAAGAAASAGARGHAGTPDTAGSPAGAVAPRRAPAASRTTSTRRRAAAIAAAPATASGSAQAAPPHTPSWSDVENALANNDTTRAASALSAIARDAHDQTTRAKARIGLVQLLVADGQCERAGRLALSVARTPGLDAELVAHAIAATARCRR